MKRVYKYPLQIGETTLPLPSGAKVLSVAMQAGVLMLWAEVWPDNEAEQRTFTVHGTGHPIPADGRRHIASVIDREFVWHVYER